MSTNEFPEPDWGPAPDNCAGSSSSGSSMSEPDWTTPQVAIPDCTSFQVAGPSPFKLTGAFIRLLQYHFSDADNIANTQLQDLIWTSSVNACADEVLVDACGKPTGEVIPGSKILIEAEYKRGGLSIQQRPAIFIKRGSVRVREVNPTIGNKATPHIDESGIFMGDLYRKYIEGTHSAICIASHGSAAEALAEEVFFRMLQYTKPIQEDLVLGKLTVDAMSDVKQYDNDPKASFYCSVNMSWAYVYQWRLIPESPVLKRMSILPVQTTPQGDS